MRHIARRFVLISFVMLSIGVGFASAFDPRDDKNQLESFPFRTDRPEKSVSDLPPEVFKFLPQPYPTAEGVEFGTYAAIDENTMVVGVIDDEQGTFAGAAYIFEKEPGGGTSWEMVRRLEAPDAMPWAYFGLGVAVQGNLVFVGAPGDDDWNGAVYVFERHQDGTNQWGFVKKITSEGACSVELPSGYGGGTVPWTDGSFGYAIAVSGETLVVGSPYGFGTGNRSGTAFVFERNQGGQENWGPITQIDFDDGDDSIWADLQGSGENDLFGRKIAIDGDTIVVGARGDDDWHSNSGAAYFFERNRGGTDNWGQRRKVTTCVDTYGGSLGRSVAIEGSVAVLGTSTGETVCLVDGDMAWTPKLVLEAPDGAAGDHFGYSVAIHDRQVMVGAYGVEAVGIVEGYGASYVFSDSDGTWDWTAKEVLRPQATVIDNCFGAWVGFSGDTWVVGDPCEEIEGHYSGTMSLFSEWAPDQWTLAEKLDAPTSMTARYDEFGRAVAVSGEVMVVGIPGRNLDCVNCGAVAVFRSDGLEPVTWELEQTLSASDGTLNDNFGSALAIDDDTIVVGCSADDEAGESSGSAYVFRAEGSGPEPWVEVAKIMASDGEADDRFGFPVAVSQDTIAVGATGDDDYCDHSGAVYLFSRDEGGTENWGQLKKIIPNSGTEYVGFGYGLDLEDSTLVIGAYGDDEKGENSGATFVFEKNHGGFGAWGLEAKILPENGTELNHFGYAVAVSGNSIAVGSLGYWGGAVGHISVFSRQIGGIEPWIYETAVHSEGECSIGFKIDISGDTIVAGCSSYRWSGAAALYRRTLGGVDHWGFVGLLEGADLSADEEFGRSVAIDGDSIIVGAPFDDSRGADCGAAYLFEGLPRDAMHIPVVD